MDASWKGWAANSRAAAVSSRSCYSGRRLKNVLATYNEAEDLINIGAYKSGSNKNIAYAISKIDAVNEFLRQATDEKFSFEEELAMLSEIFKDYEA